MLVPASKCSEPPEARDAKPEAQAAKPEAQDATPEGQDPKREADGCLSVRPRGRPRGIVDDGCLSDDDASTYAPSTCIGTTMTFDEGTIFEEEYYEGATLSSLVRAVFELPIRIFTGGASARRDYEEEYAGSGNVHIEETAIISPQGPQRQKMLADLVTKHQEAMEEDFYGMLDLQRYAEMNGETEAVLKRNFRALVLRWHPDKNPWEKREECQARTTSLCLAKHVLEDPDLKRRYDIELRQQRKEELWWNTAGWWIAWGWSFISMTGGLGLVFAGIVSTPVTGGAGLLVAASGGALFTSGMKGSIQMVQDPVCSTTEFTKDLSVGAVQGAVGGAVGCVAGTTMIACHVGGRIGIAVGYGAATTATALVISDTTDVLITAGLLGAHMKANVSKAKTLDEVLTSQNAQRFARAALLGAAIGGLGQREHLHMFVPSSALAGFAVDDAVHSGTTNRHLHPE